MAIIRFYRRRISPMKPPCCRFTPTCSAYALEAFEKRGCMAGFILMIWRILRCSPLSPCGHDPVPDKGFRTMPMRWSKFRRMQKEHPEIPFGEGVPHEPEASGRELDGEAGAKQENQNRSDESR